MDEDPAHCQQCGVLIDVGINTKYSDEYHSHMCKMCEAPLEIDATL